MNLNAYAQAANTAIDILKDRHPDLGADQAAAIAQDILDGLDYDPETDVIVKPCAKEA